MSARCHGSHEKSEHDRRAQSPSVFRPPASSASSFHAGQSGGELRLDTTVFDFLQHFWEIRLSEIASLSTPPHFPIN